MKIVGIKESKIDLHVLLGNVSLQVGEVCKATGRLALAQLMTFLTQALKASVVTVPSLDLFTYFLMEVRGIEPRTWCMLNTHCTTTELYPPRLRLH